MAGRIQITPEQIEGVSAVFKQKRGESDAMINLLNSKISSLQGQWEGQTQQKFISEFEQCKGNMKQFTTLLESISTSLDQIAKKFRETDGM
ncbi:WXG100 family type VII secretion target [Thermoactinomyces sp. DSM 45892]|uniref:WXG100 family type VII secretion target n=1 Tax=Thermoactinomyces sp. DSM 45892 TaxID=1882753 RepID=UPI000898C0D1|nr:WXG100 family type VII secretion target [Thermoactinomyces sp. DSM 45892]SDY40251.1 WXG100 family type VII secretion target [Thermoactinomyces sp. DSM 45892]